MSDVTKKYKARYYIFALISLLLTLLPIAIFVIKGLRDGSVDLENKLKLGLCLSCCLFLTFLGVKSKYRCRSVLYVALFGCYFVIKDLELVVLVCGICCIVDEFAISPLAKMYKTKYTINKEIDKRI